MQGREMTKDSLAATVMAALRRAKSLSAREARIGSGALAVLDAFRRPHEFAPAPGFSGLDPHALLEALPRYASRDYDYRSGRSWWTFPDVGDWSAEVRDGDLVLAPRRPLPACIEAVVPEADPDALAAIRGAYMNGGVDVVVCCEGASRARDMAWAIHAERTMLGLATSYSCDREEWPYRFSHEEGAPAVPDAFPSALEGPEWSVNLYTASTYGAGAIHRALSENVPAGAGSRVLVAEDRWMAIRLPGASEEARRRSRPTFLVGVTLEKSVPRLRAAVPERFAASRPMSGWTPWDALAERRERAASSRRPTPKTWHPTTEHVADAFIKQKAPRGFTGTDSLFFHGPAAFSLHHSSPVAAFVRDSDGRQVLLTGRPADWGGTAAGTVTMAQADIGRAARGRVETLDVGDLARFVTWGGNPLDRAAAGMKRRKDEDTLPDSCRIDRRRLKSWLRQEHAARLSIADKAMKTSFPTFTQSFAFGSLADLCTLRDRLAQFLRCDLPDVGRADEYRTESRRLYGLADERQRQLAERRRLADSAARQDAGAADHEDAGPAPRM